MELSTYFRINTEESGQFERTLIVAEEGASVVYLEGCTAPAFDTTSCTRRWSNWWRWTMPTSSTRRCRTGTPATRTASAASTTSSPSAGSAKGVNSRISWTQVETGSAITWKYPSVVLRGDNSVGEFYSVAVTNHLQQADTGTKMIHLGRNTRSTIVSKGISAGRSNNSYRGLVRVAPTAVGARNHSQCDSMLIGDQSGAHTFPYIDVRHDSARVEHEASTSKIGEDQLFYFAQRGISAEAAVSMIINGFCKEVFQQLPMEFAVEATQLLGIKLEGSVG
jgi:Fe-S cluster assembly protein SufB